MVKERLYCLSIRGSAGNDICGCVRPGKESITRRESEVCIGREGIRGAKRCVAKEESKIEAAEGENELSACMEMRRKRDMKPFVDR